MIFTIPQKAMATPESLPTLTIDPNGYEGNMAIDSTNPNDLFYFDGPKKVYLPEGKHSLNTGATKGGEVGPNTSFVYFTVSSTGDVQLNPTPAASLGADKRTIILNTTPVTINPGSYLSNYYLSAKNNTVFKGKDGKLHLRLVRYQLYTLDSGIRDAFFYLMKDNCQGDCVKKAGVSTKSWFDFFVDEKGLITFVDEKGQVIPNSVYAEFINGEIRLKTVSVLIDPGELSGNVPVLLPDKTVIKSKQPITVVRGLLTWVRWPTFESDAYFFVPL